MKSQEKDSICRDYRKKYEKARIYYLSECVEEVKFIPEGNHFSIILIDFEERISISIKHPYSKYWIKRINISIFAIAINGCESILETRYFPPGIFGSERFASAILRESEALIPIVFLQLYYLQ